MLRGAWRQHRRGRTAGRREGSRHRPGPGQSRSAQTHRALKQAGRNRVGWTREARGGSMGDQNKVPYGPWGLNLPVTNHPRDFAMGDADRPRHSPEPYH
eukprot:scaffold24_cov341-Pavlova_lutheri.AAC.65